MAEVKIEKEPYASEPMGSDAHYPYGTSIRFEGDMADEIGADALKVGDVVEVRGYAFVSRKAEHSSIEYGEDGHEEKSISFQFTTVNVKRETADRADMLYGPKT